MEDNTNYNEEEDFNNQQPIDLNQYSNVSDHEQIHGNINPTEEPSEFLKYTVSILSIVIIVRNKKKKLKGQRYYLY